MAALLEDKKGEIIELYAVIMAESMVWGKIYLQLLARMASNQILAFPSVNDCFLS